MNQHVEVNGTRVVKHKRYLPIYLPRILMMHHPVKQNPCFPFFLESACELFARLLLDLKPGICVSMTAWYRDLIYTNCQLPAL